MEPFLHVCALPVRIQISALSLLPMFSVPQCHKHTTCNPDTKPTLQELLKFTCTDGRVIHIPVELATDYFEFGTFLLDDKNGSKVKIIAHNHLNNAKEINTEILQEWLTGKGKKPVTWATIVEVMRDIGHFTLARDIEAVKCPAKPVFRDSV